MNHYCNRLTGRKSTAVTMQRHVFICTGYSVNDFTSRRHVFLMEFEVTETSLAKVLNYKYGIEKSCGSLKSDFQIIFNPNSILIYSMQNLPNLVCIYVVNPLYAFLRDWKIQKNSKWISTNFFSPFLKLDKL